MSRQRTASPRRSTAGRSKAAGKAGFRRLREPLTGRTVLRAQAASGPDVWVAPMPGYRKAYAMITTRYGSLDTHLPDGTVLPDGIAHFLEHKMFQTEAGDVFDLYAARGASANAFTTYTHTSYLFSATSRFDENFQTLLETMASITTDAEGIAREKGIIGQELAGYEDDPGWRGWHNLLLALYRKHPVRIDIGGTAATIAPIDAALLERTYAAYYSPANMIVTVAGDVDADRVLAETDAVLGAVPRGRRNRRPVTAEPARVAAREHRLALSVNRPQVLLGIKDRPGRGARAAVRRRIQGAMLMEILCGDGGLVQEPLYAEGLVDDSFGGYYEAEDDYAVAAITADVDDIDAFKTRLMRALRDANRAGIDANTLERCRRRFLGRHLRLFNAPEGCAHWMQGIALQGVEPGALVEALSGATVAGLRRHLRELMAAPRAWSVVEPA